MSPKDFESEASKGTLFLPGDFFIAGSDPMNAQDFKRESFTESGIVSVRLFDVTSLTPEMKESLRADMARSLG